MPSKSFALRLDMGEDGLSGSEEEEPSETSNTGTCLERVEEEVLDGANLLRLRFQSEGLCSAEGEGPEDF